MIESQPVVFVAPRVCQCATCAALPNDATRAFAQTVRALHAARGCDLEDCETCYDIALHRGLVGERREGVEAGDVLAARLHRIRQQVDQPEQPEQEAR